MSNSMESPPIVADEPGHGDPILNMLGDRVALGPLRSDLLPVYERWENDFELESLGTIHRFGPRTSENAAESFDRLTNDPRRFHFTIYERASLRPIGWTNLRDIDHYNRTAEFGISIAEPEYRERGLGTEATRLVLRFGFSALDLHSIWLNVQSHNERAMRAYRRAGFREIGRWRESKRFDGHVRDLIFMDCIATDFRAEQAIPSV